MENEVLIKVEGVSKKFCKSLKRSLYYGLGDISRSVLGIKNPDKLRKDEFWAVKNVSFKVRRGECLGLIGHNGAGKSTLLKMLNGLIRPDEGRIEMKGKVGALIELGAGFNPVLTGRENVYNNGAVLGFSKAEIDRKFDEIVAFSELEDFIDSPVQNYSSGMKVRLGFAVASQMELDILLVDEVLAVGDAGFKIKCYNEIFKILKNSAVIFVSHSMPQIAKVCTEGLHLHTGILKKKSSSIVDIIESYYSVFQGPLTTTEGNMDAIVEELEIQTKQNKLILDLKKISGGEIRVSPKEKLSLKLTYYISKKVAHRVIFFITDKDQKLISQLTTKKFYDYNINNLISLKIDLEKLQLNAGEYGLTIHIFETDEKIKRGTTLYGIRNCLKIICVTEEFVGASPILYFDFTDEFQS